MADQDAPDLSQVAARDELDPPRPGRPAMQEWATITTMILLVIAVLASGINSAYILLNANQVIDAYADISPDADLAGMVPILKVIFGIMLTLTLTAAVLGGLAVARRSSLLMMMAGILIMFTFGPLCSATLLGLGVTIIGALQTFKHPAASA